MEKNTLSKRTIITIAKKEYADELKEIILLDTLFVQTENIRYYDKANDLKWSLAVEMTDFWGYSPEHEEYYELCDKVDFVLGNFIDEQSSEILETVLDNIG